MAGLARVHPRDWDGRRLLQFLAGLALIALSFAVHLGAPADRVTPLAAAAYAAPAAAPASAPDTGPHTAPDVGGPDVGGPDVSGPAVSGAATSGPAAAEAAAAAGVHGGLPSAVAADRPVTGDAARARSVSRAGVPLAGPAGPGAHGSRAPPRH